MKFHHFSKQMKSALVDRVWKVAHVAFKLPSKWFIKPFNCAQVPDLQALLKCDIDCGPGKISKFTPILYPSGVARDRHQPNGFLMNPQLAVVC
jgi:hypothetical protein